MPDIHSINAYWAGAFAVEKRKSQIHINAEANPYYCPYCLRCPELVRMKKVEPFYWRCDCGAEHDERKGL